MGVGEIGEKGLGSARQRVICIDLENIFLELNQSLIGTMLSILQGNIEKSSRPLRVLETVSLPRIPAELKGAHTGPICSLVLAGS